MIRARLLLLLWPLLLSACGGTNVIDSDATFVGGSSEDSLVVMGIMATDWKAWLYTIDWRRQDAASAALKPGVPPGISVGNVSPEIYAKDEERDPRFLIFRVPPGTYALHSSVVIQQTYFQVTYSAIYRPMTVAFTASPGQILYIGNFIFVVPDNGFLGGPQGTRLAYFGSNIDAARKALADYPNVTGDIVAQRPSPLRME